jgi:hypothetical protein
MFRSLINHHQVEITTIIIKNKDVNDNNFVNLCLTSDLSCNYYYYYYYYYCSTALCWALAPFLVLYTVGRTPRTGHQSVARPISTHRTAKHRINTHNTDIHALSGIRNHDPRVRASEESSCFRPLGHCDWPSNYINTQIVLVHYTCGGLFWKR